MGQTSRLIESIPSHYCHAPDLRVGSSNFSLSSALSLGCTEQHSNVRPQNSWVLFQILYKIYLHVSSVLPDTECRAPPLPFFPLSCFTSC